MRYYLAMRRLSSLIGFMFQELAKSLKKKNMILRVAHDSWTVLLSWEGGASFWATKAPRLGRFDLRLHEILHDRGGVV